MISTVPVLAFYDPNRHTVVSSDASSYGIGGALSHEDDNKTLRPVTFSPRMLTPSEETMHVQTKKECLAAVWVCEKYYSYLSDLKLFRPGTDHKPLVPPINQQSVDKVPICCQRLLMRPKSYPHDTIVIYDSSLWRMRLCQKSTIPACYSLSNVATCPEDSHH